ncbi:hypothetical protein N9O58_02690 [Flavobacteriaceae bacterium]|nr:hypothetical protein [Flavobacteriaceae bacterium]
MKRILFLIALSYFATPFLSFSQSTEDFSDETISGVTITTNTGLTISSSNLDWSTYTNQLDYNNVSLSPPIPYITPSSNNDFFQITLSDQSKVFSSIEFDLWLNYGDMFGTGDMGCDCKSYTSENQLIETISKGSNEVAKNFIFNSGSIKKIICNPTNVEGGNGLLVDDIVFTIAQLENNNDILLNGTTSAENNQIKNIADPTDAQDAATKSYVDTNVNSFSGSYNDLTDQPSLRDLTGDNPVIFGSLSAFGGTYNNRAILDLVANTEGNLITGYKNGAGGDRFNVKLDNTNENALVSSGGGYNLKLYSEGGTMEFEGDDMMSTPSFTFNGAVTATSFAGDGSQLTNLPTSDVSYNDLTDKPTTYTQAQVDALIQNLQTQIDGLTPPQGTAAINHNNKTYSGVSCEGFWLGFKFSVSETQTITALGAWDEGHNVDVNNEFSSCPDASNFSVPIAIYKNDVLVLEKVINASTGFVIGSSRYIKIDDFVLTPGDEYFIIGNYEGSSKSGYFDSNLVSSNYDSRITPLTVTSSPLFSKNTNGDGTFPSNLTTLPDNQWSDQYFHVNFLLKN